MAPAAASSTARPSPGLALRVKEISIFGISTPLEWALAAARAILWFSIANARAGFGFSSASAAFRRLARRWRGLARRPILPSAARVLPTCTANAARRRGAGHPRCCISASIGSIRRQRAAPAGIDKRLERQRKSRNREAESNVNHVCFGNFSQSDVPCRERDRYDHPAYPAWCAPFSNRRFPLKAQ